MDSIKKLVYEIAYFADEYGLSKDFIEEHGPVADRILIPLLCSSCGPAEIGTEDRNALAFFFAALLEDFYADTDKYAELSGFMKEISEKTGAHVIAFLLSLDDPKILKDELDGYVALILALYSNTRLLDKLFDESTFKGEVFNFLEQIVQK